MLELLLELYYGDVLSVGIHLRICIRGFNTGATSLHGPAFIWLSKQTWQSALMFESYFIVVCSTIQAKIFWAAEHHQAAIKSFSSRGGSLYRFNDEVKHIKVIEKDSWIHITEAKKFESLLVRNIQDSTAKTKSRKKTPFLFVLEFNRSWWSTISPIRSKKASSC